MKKSFAVDYRIFLCAFLLLFVVAGDYYFITIEKNGWMALLCLLLTLVFVSGIVILPKFYVGDKEGLSIYYLPFVKEHFSAIARWTYAPENDKDQSFAKTLKKYGIVASAGHTDATYPDMLPAFENGCDLITHLYSCTSTVTRDHGFRRLGVIETAYLLDDMYVEIICDGKHLPPELIKLIYKIKGAERIALVTDSLALAGTDKTHGFMQDTEFIIEDGVCKLMDRSAFAGSIATADRLVRVAVEEADIPVWDAVKMITATPAKIMGLSRKGRIAPNMDADLTVFDGDIKIKAVFTGGDPVK